MIQLQQAGLLPNEVLREALLEKARQFEAQIYFNDELFKETTTVTSARKPSRL